AARRVTTHADGRAPLLRPAPLAGPPHRPHLLTPPHRLRWAIKGPPPPSSTAIHATSPPTLASSFSPQRRRRSYSSPPPPAPVAPPLHATLARGEAGDR